MKSAIFQDRQPPVQATERGGTKRLQTQPSQALLALSPTAGTPASTTCPTWTLGDLFANYTASGALPAPLSPTLPPQFEGLRLEPEDNEHDDDSADSDANVPVSLISPVPPQRTQLEQLTPKTTKARTVRSVRVVNRLVDPDRPRLLVRINYRPHTKSRRPGKSDERRSTTSTGSRPPEPKKDNVASDDAEFRPRAAWAALIRELQAQCERAAKSEFFFSLLVHLDAIMCSVVACEPEDRRVKPSVAERNWLHVHASVPQFVTRIERHLKVHPVSEKRKAMLSFLVANLAVVRALLLKRVVGLLLLQLRNDTDVNRVHDVQKRIIECYQKMEDNFAQSQTFFSLSPPPATVFPQSWHNRASSIPRPVGLPLSPATDKYFLPLGIYSDLREAVAYLHSCVREFAEILGPDLNGDVRYTLQSGQKR